MNLLRRINALIAKEDDELQSTLASRRTPQARYAKFAAHDKLISEALRRASAKVYADWLIGFMANGGEPTCFCDGPISSIYVAKRHFSLPCFCGSLSLRIIVPTQVVVVEKEGHSHNNLFFMDGYKQQGDWVPVYADVYKIIKQYGL